MEFRTELQLQQSGKNISLHDKVVTIGSCFADEIGARLAENKFSVLINPFGTIYNPISIHKTLLGAIDKTSPSPDGFLQRDDHFYHFDFHSDWNGRSVIDLQEKLKTQLANVHSTLANSGVLMITYGTAWVYETRKIKGVVANCHKMPQQNFDKFLLTQKRIVESFDIFYRSLKKVNPTCRVILTVSPVRHIKDTLQLNSVSKSILRLTCHTLTEAFQDVEYFPAYEIILDDLRDYRFYKPDMIHPSSQAIDYVWEKFSDAYFTADAKAFLQKWDKIKTALQHKPFHPEGDSHQKFLRVTLERLNELKLNMDVSREIEKVKSQLR